MSDVIRDTFLKFVADGMTHLEALMQFDRDEFNTALQEELNLRGGECTQDPHSLLNLAGQALREEADLYDLEQAIELWLAGWTSYCPRGIHECPVMSWYWRAPAKRKWSKGRRYLSTNQAFNALRKEQRQTQ